MGTYGFLYIATIEPQLTPLSRSIEMNEIKTVSALVQQAEMNYVELDMEQVLITALAEVHPPLTIKQQVKQIWVLQK